MGLEKNLSDYKSKAARGSAKWVRGGQPRLTRAKCPVKTVAHDYWLLACHVQVGQ
jgi:hypothetical protein